MIVTTSSAAVIRAGSHFQCFFEQRSLVLEGFGFSLSVGESRAELENNSALPARHPNIPGAHTSRQKTSGRMRHPPGRVTGFCQLARIA